MKKYIQYIMVLLCVVPSLSSRAGNATDAEFLSLKKIYTLKSNGDVTMSCAKVLKLNTHAAFNRFYGETFVVYNPQYQEVKIHEAYTVMADGTKVLVPDNAFNEVLPGWAAGAPAYNHLRELVITHTGLEVGAVIHLEYEVTTKAGFFPYFMGHEMLAQSSPVKAGEIVVRIPEKMQLAYRLKGLRSVPAERVYDGMREYVWIFTNIAAQSHERFLQENSTPELIFGETLPVEKALYRALDQKAFKMQENPLVTEWLNAILADKKDNRERIKAIHQAVVKEIHTFNIEPQYSGWRVCDAETVFKANGGTSLEKALLMADLLHMAGIGYEVMAVVPEADYDALAFNLLTVKQFVVRADVNKSEHLLLSPNRISDVDLQWLLGGERLIGLTGKPGLVNYVLGERTGSVIVNGELFFSNDQIKGEMVVTSNGACNPYHIVNSDSKGVNKLLTAWDATASLSAKGESTVSGSEVTMSIEEQALPSDHKGYFSFQLPDAQYGIEQWYIHYLYQERQHPLVLPGLLKQVEEYTITLDGEMTLINQSGKKQVKSDAGLAEVEMTVEKGVVRVKRTLEINSRMVGVKGYQSFRDMISLWNSDKYSVLQIKKK